MSPDRNVADRAQLRFPRVSGDEPPAYKDAKITNVFSPRERG